MAIDLVCNTGPILALGKMGLLDELPSLGLNFAFPRAVADELDLGVRMGFPIPRPASIPVLEHEANPSFEAALDRGEAAVLHLALVLGVGCVCIDEWRGRRAAHALGLRVIGSLGILGRMFLNGIVTDLRQTIEKATLAGVWYDPALLERFLNSVESKGKPSSAP